MKKAICCLLILTAVILCETALPASAYGEAIIQAETVSAAPGGTVSVDVTITNNPGILGAELTVEYPADNLTLVGATAGEAFGVLTMTPPGSLATGCKFIWDGPEITSDDVKDGLILTLKFSVSSAVQTGAELPIKLSVSAEDNELSPVPANVVNGMVCVGGNTGFPGIAPVSSALEGSTFTVTLRSDDAYSGIILISAACCDNGKQSGYELKTVGLRPGENTYQFKADDPDAAYRVFVLDGHYRPCCPAISVGEHTSTATTIYGSHVSARSGATSVGVTLSIRNNPGIAGLQFAVSYDDSVLTLTGVTRGSALTEGLTMSPPGKFEPSCRFVWDSVGVIEQASQGDILTLWFDVASGAASAVYPISLSECKAVDNNMQSVAVDLENASIRVTG